MSITEIIFVAIVGVIGLLALLTHYGILATVALSSVGITAVSSIILASIMFTKFHAISGVMLTFLIVFGIISFIMFLLILIMFAKTYSKNEDI